MSNKRSSHMCSCLECVELREAQQRFEAQQKRYLEKDEGVKNDNDISPSFLL